MNISKCVLISTSIIFSLISNDSVAATPGKWVYDSHDDGSYYGALVAGGPTPLTFRCFYKNIKSNQKKSAGTVLNTPITGVSTDTRCVKAYGNSRDQI